LKNSKNEGLEGEHTDRDNLYNVSSDRIKLLNRIESVQNAFFETLERYKSLKKISPESDECNVLKEKCHDLADESQSLVDLL